MQKVGLGWLLASRQQLGFQFHSGLGRAIVHMSRAGEFSCAYRGKGGGSSLFHNGLKNWA